MNSADPDCESACIVVDNIAKTYDTVQVVSGLSFTVNGGEIFGLLGPNGAGKTTTIRMMLQMISPNSGSVKVFGAELSEKTKEWVGYLPEERGLYENLSVMENISYIASLRGADKDKAEKVALGLLYEVGLEDYVDKKVGKLSKGMKQLVQLISTIVHDPSLLVLDEPFSGLDPSNREVVKKIILEQKKNGKTIVLSTHMMNEVEEICDRIVVVDRGRRILYGRVDDIKHRYATHSIYLEFSGKLPELDGVETQVVKKNTADLRLRIDVSPQSIFKQLANTNIKIKRFDVKEISLNQVFIELVGAEKKWVK